MKQTLIVAAVLSTFASQVQAQSQGRFYATTAMGSSHMSHECPRPAGVDCHSRGLGFKVLGGYEFGNGWGVEAGYLSFGKIGFSADELMYYQGKAPTAVALGGTYTMALSHPWGLNLRLGVARVTTTRMSGYWPIYYSDRETRTKAYGGVGVTYAISPTVKLELGVDSTQSEVFHTKRAVSMISIGTTVSF